jgi:oxygen-independent coproporphyrinogen-3 oxidase
VHFPFCAHKCPYCDFNSHAGREAEIDAYIDALLDEAEAWRELVQAQTIFIGGGTPTQCSASQLERYVSGLREKLAADTVDELTIEANPGTVDAAKVRALRRAGVNRVSLGAQSFDDRHLKTLGRIHNASDTVRSSEIVRNGGIERVSLDLILATPGQSLSAQARDLARVLDLGPEHVSAYVLTFEEGTVFTRRMQEGHIPPPVDERDLAHLHLACERLAAAGLARYEVSNFARPGCESRHNLAYWRNADWLGLGAGAHSHAAGRRWKNVDDPAAYIRGVAGDDDALIEWREAMPVSVQLFESLMMGLRLIDGVDLDVLTRRYGVDVRVTFADALRRQREQGLIHLEGPMLRLSERGLDLANAVISDYYPDEEL